MVLVSSYPLSVVITTSKYSRINAVQCADSRQFAEANTSWRRSRADSGPCSLAPGLRPCHATEVAKANDKRNCQHATSTIIDIHRCIPSRGPRSVSIMSTLRTVKPRQPSTKGGRLGVKIDQEEDKLKVDREETKVCS